jgi:uncharacterized protein GlcG (DUF336 family)
MPRLAEGAIAAGFAAVVAACSGGGGGATGCGDCVAVSTALTEADVQRVIAQAVGEAQARGIRAHVAVVDRVGNVLATFAMNGAPDTVTISSGLGVRGGLEGAKVPATLAAVSKAVTGAYLSSQGNAFTTRTAGQIVQEHFNPNEAHQPSGPLYGVQFSQLACSDVVRGMAAGSAGPRPSPLGLAADPGGLPLYKNGVLAGGIGIEADGLYSFDRDLTDVDENDEESIAVAGGAGFAAPTDIRGDRITADGRTFRYVDSESLRSNPQQAPAFAGHPGSLVAVAGFSSAAISTATAFGTPSSGIRADTGSFAAAGGWILVNGENANRFPPRDATAGGLRAADVQALLAEALAVARRARAQIRRPIGSAAQVTIAVVDTEGEILGLVRTSDGPVFGIDVAVQKARTAMFFSHPSALAELQAAPAVGYLDPGVAPFRSLGGYATDFYAFTATAPGTIAWSARAIGNLHRPFYPDGLEGSPRGPLSTPITQWSPFNVGFQLDLVYNQVVKAVLGDGTTGCAGRLPVGQAEPQPIVELRKLRNGAQVFPGGVPIYRGDTLVGGIGVSGDGVDQDDMVAYLAVENAARAGAAVANAPAARRSDTLAPMGTRLRYIQCPQSPFNGSTEQNACG